MNFGVAQQVMTKITKQIGATAIAAVTHALRKKKLLGNPGT